MAKRNNVAMWVCLGIVALVLGVAGLLVLNNHLETQRQFKLNEQSQKQEEKEQQEAKTEQSFEELTEAQCLTDAYDAYEKNWNKESKSLGRTDGKLPADIMEVHEQRYKEAKEDCRS